MFVLGLAFSLVFVIARWLGASSDGSSEETPAATQAGAEVSATQTVTAGETPTAPVSGSGTAGTGSTEPTLAAPEGTCAAEDVVLTPSVVDPAEGGDDVTLTLSLQTSESEACTWQVSRSTVSVKISRGAEVLWTSHQCPRAIPSQSVVVRRAVATEVELTWNARESAAGCSPRTDWVLPGDYTIHAAALGGEPASSEFTLRKPAPQTVQVTPKATKTPSAKATKKPTKPTN
ncbi:hypothetical protein ASE01_02015 [Nocardioides sp. Root190]|nr:hypothetical protein ASE01_02015 [Nocardioides sp. Root190]